MHDKDDMQWLEEQNLIDIAKANSVYFRKVLKNCLSIKKREELIIIGDKGEEGKRVSPLAALSYYLAARDMNIPARLMLQEEPKYSGDKADKDIADFLYECNSGKVFALALSGMLGNIKDVSSSFRSYTKENRHRFVSTTSLGQLPTEKFYHLTKALDTDYGLIQKRGNEIKQLLDSTTEVYVNTKAGTDFYFTVKGKKAVASVGNFKEQGSGGNIPIGEVFMPPKWKHAEGTIVVDGSSACRFGTTLVKNPIKIKVEEDEIVSIKGREEAKKLEGSLIWAARRSKHPWGIKRIGELGIGINPNARIVGAMIIDEKTLGTAHFGIGSNYWFGGTIYAITHYDQVIRNPRIFLDDELLDVQSLFKK